MPPDAIGGITPALVENTTLRVCRSKVQQKRRCILAHFESGQNAVSYWSKCVEDTLPTFRCCDWLRGNVANVGIFNAVADWITSISKDLKRSYAAPCADAIYVNILSSFVDVINMLITLHREWAWF